ncbi:MAG: hypothetical protein JW709_08640 [Sedimentisphaerales bacterium]|nr:hypothetical protein [Sedimentisphaerales bacterium]
MNPRKLWYVFLVVVFPAICHAYPSFYGETENLCGDLWFTGAGCSYMPPFHPYDFDINWGNQGPVIKVGSCGGVTPAKGTIKFTGGPGLEDPYDPDDPWVWYQCDSKGDPNSPMDCTGSPFLPYSWLNTYVIKCTPYHTKDPNEASGEGDDAGEEDIFTYPECGMHGYIEIGLKDDSCATLRKLNPGDYVKVEIEIWRWVWVNRCCTEGDMANCLGYTYFCECIDQEQQVHRIKGEMIEKKKVYMVRVEFTEGNPCK